MGNIRLLVAGGRDYQFTPADIRYLDTLLSNYPIVELIQGGATGADKCAYDWATANHISPIKTFPGDWNLHGKAAGPIRNRQMAQYMTEQEKQTGVRSLVVLFPGNRGTADMKRAAEAAGLRVVDRALPVKEAVECQD